MLRYLLQRKTVRDLKVEAAQVTKRVKAEKRAEKRMDEGAAVVELEDLTDQVSERRWQDEPRRNIRTHLVAS